MKIPDNRNPYEVIINGAKKTYGAGDTVADDAAVKQIIDNEGLFPPKAPETVLPFIDTAAAEKLNHMEDEIENANEPFIVTLTPTSEDLSGIMDKTPQELFEAWTAGKTIIADVPDLGTSFVFTTASFADLDDDGEKDAAYLAANFWYEMGGQDLYMVILTQTDGYSVYPFALTPANAG